MFTTVTDTSGKDWTVNSDHIRAIGPVRAGRQKVYLHGNIQDFDLEITESEGTALVTTLTAP